MRSEVISKSACDDLYIFSRYEHLLTAQRMLDIIVD